MSPRLRKLADSIRMASRLYDSGKRDLAIKMVSSVASKLDTIEDRRSLRTLVEKDIKQSGIHAYFQSIIFGQGGTSVR